MRKAQTWTKIPYATSSGPRADAPDDARLQRFSYRDLSELVGVKTSSIHYYFPSKEDLAFEAVNAYSADVMSSIYAIDSSAPADKKLDRYAKVLVR